MIQSGAVAMDNIWAIILLVALLAFSLMNMVHYFFRSQYLSSILSNAPTPWCVVNRKTEILNRFSPQLLTLLGSKESRLTLEKLLNHFADQDKETLRQWIIQGPADKEISLKAANGSALSMRRHPLNETLVLIWMEDKTAYVQAKTEAAEALLKQNHMEHLLDSLPFPLWGRDTKTHRLTFVNTAYADFTSKSREDILREQYDFYKQKRHQSGIYTPLQHHFIVEGSRRLFEFSEYQNVHNKQIVGFGKDITTQEQLQGDLRRNISSNYELLEYLSTDIAIYDADMRLKFFNHAYAKTTEALGSFLHGEPTLSEVLDELRRHRLLPEMIDFQAYKKRQMAMFTSLSEPIHELNYLPNGQIHRMVIAPHPLGGLIFMFENMTERIGLESQYNTLIAVQKATIDNLYEGVVVFSSDNRLRLSNPAFCRIWKLSDEQAQPGRHMSQVMDDTKDLFFKGIAWTAFREKMIDNITNRRPKTGLIKRLDDRVVEYAYVPLPDGANMVHYLDITDTTKVETALRERNEALETTDKLKSQFVANISYELRSPLNSVLGFAEIMLNEYFGPLNAKQREYVNGIVDSSRQLMILINGILDLASIEAGQMTLKHDLIFVPKLLDAAIAELKKSSEEQGHIIQTDYAESLHMIVGDKRQLQQVFYNLVSNAIKFTPNHGHIHIKVFQDTSAIVIQVIDTGFGIDPKDHSRVFDKFERISAFPQAGAGLGLALVKNFIELHNGSVEITSTIGQGTTVTCRLPFNPTVLIGP